MVIYILIHNDCLELYYLGWPYNKGLTTPLSDYPSCLTIPQLSDYPSCLTTQLSDYTPAV